MTSATCDTLCYLCDSRQENQMRKKQFFFCSTLVRKKRVNSTVQLTLSVYPTRHDSPKFRQFGQSSGLFFFSSLIPTQLKWKQWYDNDNITLWTSYPGSLGPVVFPTHFSPYMPFFASGLCFFFSMWCETKRLSIPFSHSCNHSTATTNL